VASFKSNLPAVQQFFRTKAINALDRAGQQGTVEAASRTRRATGFAADSAHYVVNDESGNQVAGDTTDGNQNPVPQYPATGMVTVHVGSNTAASDKGEAYAIYLERGVQGRPGDVMYGQALDVMEAVADRELGR